MKNPIIATTLYKTGFLESWGTGVSRMVEACKAVGLPEPQYGTDGLFVWITFKRPCSVGNTNDGKGNNSVDSPIDSPIDSPDKIRVSSEVVDKIYSLIKEKQTISADELAKVTGKSIRTIRKGIRILKEKGRIKRVDSPTVGGKWEIIEKQE